MKIKVPENSDTLSILLLALFSIIPIWFFQDFNSIDIIILVIFLVLFLIIVFLNLLIIKINDEKFRKFTLSIFISTIFFYGIDSKIGLWTLFKSLSDIGLIKYLASLSFVVIIIALLSFVAYKNYRDIKKIFLMTAFFFFLANLSINYFLVTKSQKIDDIEILNDEKINPNLKEKKTIILFLDQIVGYNGIDDKIEYGSLAKKSYFDLFKKYDFKLFSSAYSIYRSTYESYSHLLNFDYQTSSNNHKSYIERDLADKQSKWFLKKNKFFENSKNLKISSFKNDAINYCSKLTDHCISSNTINNLKNYKSDFQFSSTDFFFKKMHQQNSIIFQYFWRIFYKTNLLNHYESLTFNKVKFEKDLEKVNQFISSTNYNIYLFHFIFPHRPFFFDVNLEQKNCSTNINLLDNAYYKNNNEILNQHYKEIICTNFYLDKFLSKLDLKKTKLLIVSDTGVQSDDKNSFKRDSYSVLFALKQPKNKFQIDDKLISSQELFSYFFNQEHNSSIIKDDSNRFIFLDKEKVYTKINKF